MNSIGASRKDIDLLHPLVVLLGLMAVRVHMKALAALIWPEVRTWDIGDSHVETAAVAIAVFTVALLCGAFAGHRLGEAYSLRLITSPRPAGFHTWLAFAGVLVMAVVQLYALQRIVREYGSIAELLIQQQTVAGGIKDAGLGPLYALMNASVISVQLYVIRMMECETKSIVKRSVTWLLIAIATVPFLILSRRSPLLLFVLPILYYYHHRVSRVKPFVLVILGCVVFVAMSAIVFVRMQLNPEGVDLVTILKTPEYSSFDVLALTVENEDRLSRYVDPAYLLDHSAFFREYYLGALIAGELFGFQLQGGATPPTLAGSGYLLAGLPGATFYGFAVGGIVAYAYQVLKRSGHLIAFAGYLFFVSMQIVMNGDIYLLGIVWLRLVLVASLFFHLLFGYRLVKIQPLEGGV